MSRFAILIFACLSVLSSTSHAETRIHKWSDYTKPFTTRIKVLSDKPSILQVDLPISIVDQDKVKMSISTSSTKASRVSISVNNMELPFVTIGLGAKIIFPKGILKVGNNNIKFECIATSYKNTDIATLDVYELEFDLSPAGPTVVQTSQPSPAKPIETKAPVEPISPIIQQQPERIEPESPKREETPQTEKNAITPQKDMKASRARPISTKMVR